MGGNKYPGVTPTSGASIEITFTYRGQRCRERLRLTPTPANLKKASNHRAAIIDAIDKGQFDYRVTFPESKRAKEFYAVPGDAQTMDSYLDAWLDRKKTEVKASTYVGYKDTVISHLAANLGRIMLSELTRAQIVEICRKWSVADKTVRNRLSVLRSALDDAVQDGLINISPMYGWKYRSTNPQKKKKAEHVEPFTASEQKAILKQLSGQDYNVFKFMFWTGLRTSEVVGLNWGDIDWNKEEIHVSRALTRAAIRAGEMDEGTKTDSGDRRVKILKPAMTVLLEQKQHTYIANDAIFHNPRTGERWRGADPIWDRWKRTLQLAKVKYRNPYQTRHTYASMMLTAGESDRWVAAQMGHSDVGMINQIYGKWIADAKPDAGNKAVALFFVDNPKAGTGG